MKARSRLTAALVAGAALASPALASAAPMRSIQFDSGVTGWQSVGWQSVGSGALYYSSVYDAVGCAPLVHECDDTLIQLPAPGSLHISTSSVDPQVVDADLRLFASNATGEVGDEIARSGGPDATEAVGAFLAPGYYIARVDYALAVNGEVDALARYRP